MRRAFMSVASLFTKDAVIYMEIVTPDIKMIAIDIDGTLLTPEQQIAPATITAVQAAQREGIIVTLATARR